jgi:hypothetical protein
MVIIIFQLVGDYNISIGSQSLRKAVGSNNIAIGNNVLSGFIGSNRIQIGDSSQTCNIPGVFKTGLNTQTQQASVNETGGYITWNYTSGGGELDIIGMSGTGTGGVNLYSQNTNGSVSNPLLSLSASNGNVSVPGTITTAGITNTGLLNANGGINTPNLTAGNFISANENTFVNGYLYLGQAAANSQFTSGSSSCYISYTGNFGGYYVLTPTSSSITKKTNVMDITKEESEQIYKMRPVKFNYKDDLKRECIGFIAEEMYEIEPRVVPVKVTGDKIEPQSINYEQLIPLLVAELKTMKTKIDQLTQTVTELKSMVS